ncbi:SDR family NAD(P)-dependent oxidoreductase [Pseudomonas sp. KK18]|uniref:SDR family NAD(P)-dependent oxidoreductase n=1 Tax=Pseudomonas sp. KK18 TaxID=3123039 RepID=UPI0030D408FF
MTIKRQALVTGANKGIGLAIAKGLAEAGFFVWIGARDRNRGEQAVAQLRDAGLGAGLLERTLRSKTVCIERQRCCPSKSVHWIS